jgi:hypothetical protein
MKIKLILTVLYGCSIIHTHGQRSVYTGDLKLPRSAETEPVQQAASDSIVTVKKGQNNAFDVLWMTPDSLYRAKKDKLLELAIQLPDSITEKIDLFFNTGDTIVGINPFLSWQFKITAVFMDLADSSISKKDAFYYESFTRDTSDSDFRNWTWKAIPTADNMRIRFAPPAAGNYECYLAFQQKGKYYFLPPFQFKVSESTSLGRVTVGPSKRYLRLGPYPFFPIGQNLIAPRCEYCYTNTLKHLPTENEQGLQALETWMKEPTTLLGFINYESQMKSLADEGGNYFRELLAPQHQGIEWEELGNYKARMNRAWELDRQVRLAEDIGLWIQLNLQIHFPVTTDPMRTIWNWSIDPVDKGKITTEVPRANPYNVGIPSTENTDPNTFFSDPIAQKYYKEKLRYIISRWGYSTHIAAFELFSEIQNACTDPEICPQWSKTMTSYLKNELACKQLLIPSLTGGHGKKDYSEELLKDSLLDLSAFNWYASEPYKYENIGRIIGEYTTTYERPFFFGEVGNDEIFKCDTARIEWIRDAWFTTFSGNAGTGMNWDEPDKNYLRKHLGNIQTFMHGIELEQGDEAWVPMRILSDNRQAETLFLKSPDNTHAVGILSNRFYNYAAFADSNAYTAKNISCADRIPQDPGFNPTAAAGEKGVWEKTVDESPHNYIDRTRRNTEMNLPQTYFPFQPVNQKENRHNQLHIYNLNRARYVIEYYDARTLEWLGKSINWGPTVAIEYPELTIDHGFILFKLRPSNTESFETKALPY